MVMMNSEVRDCYFQISVFFFFLVVKTRFPITNFGSVWYGFFWVKIAKKQSLLLI